MNIACQQFYLLNQLKCAGLSSDALLVVLTALVTSRLMHDLPTFTRLLNAVDKRPLKFCPS
jgi:hypothetical protein